MALAMGKWGCWLAVAVHVVVRGKEAMDALLSELRNKFDVLFLQEPPWWAIRRIPSTTNRQGNEIVGAPKHPD